MIILLDIVNCLCYNISFVQYYNGTTAHYPSARKIYEHRDEITVSWKILPTREACRETERQWIEQYNPEWNDKSGWS